MLKRLGITAFILMGTAISEITTMIATTSVDGESASVNSIARESGANRGDTNATGVNTKGGSVASTVPIDRMASISGTDLGNCNFG
jgi:hypothetical protein